MNDLYRTHLENIRKAIFEITDQLIADDVFHPGHRSYLRRLLPDLGLIDAKVLLDHLNTNESQNLLAENMYRLSAVDGWSRELVFATEEQLSTAHGDALRSVADSMAEQNLTEEEKQQQWAQIESDMFRADDILDSWNRELDEMLKNSEISQFDAYYLRSLPSNSTLDLVANNVTQHLIEIGPRAYHQTTIEKEKQATNDRRNLVVFLTAVVIGFVILANS